MDDPAKFDSVTKGRVWRMGNNFWSELYTDLPLTISGKPIAPGLYFLGLERSADGSAWRLAFYDPAKVRESHTDAFYLENAKYDFTVPMELEPASPTAVEKLTITITHPKDDIEKATLNIAWGHLALTAPVKITVG